MNETINAVFLRHGHSMSAAESGTDLDALRKLSEKGKEEITQTAKQLIKMKFTPDLILTSPLLRAVETSQIIISIFNNPPEPVTLKELACQADPLFLMNAICPHIIDNNFPIIIGHQPVLGALCGYISNSNPIGMDTGSFVIIEIDRLNLNRNFKRNSRTAATGVGGYADDSCGKIIEIYNP